MFIIITLYFKTFLCQSFYEKCSAYLLSRLLAQNSSKQMHVNKQHYRVLGTFAAKHFRKLSKRMVPCSLLDTIYIEFLQRKNFVCLYELKVFFVALSDNNSHAFSLWWHNTTTHIEVEFFMKFHLNFYPCVNSLTFSKKTLKNKSFPWKICEITREKMCAT